MGEGTEVYRRNGAEAARPIRFIQWYNHPKRRIHA